MQSHNTTFRAAHPPFGAKRVAEYGALVLRGIVGVALLTLVLAGCTVESDSGLLSPGLAQQPFPGEALVVSPNEGYILKANGDSYDITNSESLSNVIFVPLGADAPGFYVAQAKQISGGFTYALVEVRAESVWRYNLAGAGSYAESLGIAFTETEQGIKLADADGLFTLLRAIRDQGSAETAFDLKVFDLGDEAERAAAVAYVDELQTDKEEEAEDTTEGAEVRVTEDGSWTYREEVDPLDDSQKQFVMGRPSEASGMEAEPYIWVGCYDDGIGIGIYWGNVMSDMYPNNTDWDFVNVSTRFDAGEVAQLGWSPSEDWTTTFPPDPLSGALAQMGNALVSSFVGEVNTTWDAAQFQKAMMGSDQLVVRASSRSGTGSVTLTFDLAGYHEVVQSFRSFCR